MKIDIRLLIVPAAPFVALALIRAPWFVAGAEWTDPAFAAAMSLFGGLAFGGILTAMLFADDVPLGYLHFGGKDEAE